MSDLNSVEKEIRILNADLSEKLDTQNLLLKELVVVMRNIEDFLKNSSAR